MRRLFVALTILVAVASRGDDLKRGEIVDGVVTASNAQISYAYYLPKNYTPEKKWPLLYVFDPRQRGAFAAGLFRDAAEEFGWILVSSNNTRSDTNTELNIPALDATLPDARRRFSIDRKREYAAGFSGTAILAWALAMTTDEIAGVIGCSGRPINNDYRVSFAWFGAAGNRDFNYLETTDIERGLSDAGVAPHQLEIFDGRHRWAPPDVLRRGVEWLEIEAMRRGLRSRDAGIIQRAYDAQLKLAETDPDILAKERRYVAMLRTFDGLVDIADVRNRDVELRKSSAFAKARKEEERAQEFERNQLRRVYPVITQFLQSNEPMQAPALAHDLDVPRLQRLAAAGSYGGLAAQRVLETIHVQLGFYAGQKVSGPKLLVAKAVAEMIYPPQQ